MGKSGRVNSVRIVFCLLIFLFAASGCRPPASPPQVGPPASTKEPDALPAPAKEMPVVDLRPKPIFELPLNDYVDYVDVPRQMVSPAGDYLVAFGRGFEIIALPLREDLDRKTLYKPAASMPTGQVGCVLLGWTSEYRFLFLAVDPWPTQTEGKESENRAIRLYEGNISAWDVREVTRFALPQGVLRHVAWNRSTGEVFVHVSGGSIWEMDAAAATSRRIREGLPSWDGMFQAFPSPTGEAFAYSGPLEGTTALSVFDTRSGSETRIHPDGIGWSIFPQWSPDGRYLAALMAGRSEGAEGNSSEAFELIPYEDGPYYAAKNLIIYDFRQSTYRVASVGGKWISELLWSPDSSRLMFLGGSISYDPKVPPPESVNATWDSLWALDAREPASPVKVADLPKAKVGPKTLHHLSAVSPDGRAGFVNVSGATLGSVWCLEEGKAPVELAEGNLWSLGQVVLPKSFIAGTLYRGPRSQDLWLLGSGASGQQIRTAVMGEYIDGLKVVGYNRDIVVVEVKSNWAQRRVLAVYKLSDLIP